MLLLGLLDSNYKGEDSSPELRDILTMHSKRSAGGEKLPEEGFSLLMKVIILRQRDHMFYTNPWSHREADESHAFFIRACMQRLNMYWPGTITHEEFAEYVLDFTSSDNRSFIWGQQEQQIPRHLKTS